MMAGRYVMSASRPLPRKHTAAQTGELHSYRPMKTAGASPAPPPSWHDAEIMTGLIDQDAGERLTLISMPAAFEPSRPSRPPAAGAVAAIAKLSALRPSHQHFRRVRILLTHFECLFKVYAAGRRNIIERASHAHRRHYRRRRCGHYARMASWPSNREIFACVALRGGRREY